MKKPMTKRTLFLPDDLWGQLSKLHERTGAPIAELIRRAIVDYLKRQKGQKQ